MLRRYRGKACGPRQEQRQTKRTAQQDTGGKVGWSQHGRDKTRQEVLSATKCAKELEIKRKNTAERSNICNNQWNEFQPPKAKQERMALDRSRSDMWIFYVAMQLLCFAGTFSAQVPDSRGWRGKKYPLSPKQWVVCWHRQQDSPNWTQLPYRWDREVPLTSPSASVACLGWCHSLFPVNGRQQKPFPVTLCYHWLYRVKASPCQLATVSLQQAAAGGSLMI